MHTILWSNGETSKASTWQGLLDLVRSQQWRELTEADFREEMAKRAWVWSCTSIDFSAPPKQFFMELADAGLIKIVEAK